jgi:hypothetical protein
MSQDSIFYGGGDWQFNAEVNYPHDAHELMTEGYLRAGQRLMESISANPQGVDFMVYPMVYLHRHWFELRLKNIIDQGRQLLQEGAGYPQGHKLQNLWPLARQILEKVWSESDRPPEFDLINRAVADFENFDSDSQSFRYPIDSKGNKSLQGLSQINLQHFFQKMEEISGFLDGAASGISSYLDDLRSSY